MTYTIRLLEKFPKTESSDPYSQTCLRILISAQFYSSFTNLRVNREVELDG